MSVITKEIGRVSIVPKGVWNGQNTYTRLDLVSYNGSSYIAKQNVPANINLNNNDYWKLVAEKGDIGISISDVRKTGTSVLTDTYTIDFTDGTNTTFEIENGNGILNITKTGTSGIVDTYTITFTNGTSTTFNVTNGSDIASITKTGTSVNGLVDTYTVMLTNDETHTFEVRNGNGIASITKTGTSANRLTDTYTITFEDGTSTAFNVNHGVGILSITGPVSSGLTDTYTINFTDGTNTTFDVQNAKSIESITKFDVNPVSGHTDTYRINYNDGTHFDYEIYNGQDGTGSVSTVDGVQASSQDVSLLIFGNAPPTTSTVGQLKQRYYDRTNEILYICTGIDTSGAQAVYTWQGTGVPVDNQLDENSENPVQNKVLTAIIGTDELPTGKDNLIDAVNDIDSIVKAHSAGKLNTDVVVASWSPAAKQYNEGDYILYSAKLYRCIESHLSTAGRFDSSKWQQITVTSELDTKAPVGLGITNASVGKVPVIKTVDANGVPTSYEAGPGVPAGGTDGDVLVKNGAAAYSGKWTNTPKQMGSIATIETSPVTQKQLYNRGDYLVYNGTLYRTQDQITAGQTLTPGGNIVAATVMDSKADKSATIPAVRFFDSGNTTQRTLHIPNAARFMLAIAASSSAYMGLWLGLSFSGGAVQPLVDVKGQGGYTFAYGTNTLTITTDSRQLEFCIWLLDGNNTDDYYII